MTSKFRLTFKKRKKSQFFELSLNFEAIFRKIFFQILTEKSVVYPPFFYVEKSIARIFDASLTLNQGIEVCVEAKIETKSTTFYRKTDFPKVFLDEESIARISDFEICVLIDFSENRECAQSIPSLE
jgi:hypothetical protein